MTKATTFPEATQHVWDFVDIGEDVEVDFNGAHWVATVSAAARRERLKRANNGDWDSDRVHSASRAAARIVQAWQPHGWDRYSGPRDALINVLALAAYIGGDEYYVMIENVFGEDIFATVYSSQPVAHLA